MNRDIEQLRLLAIFHYVVALLAAMFACFPIIHLVIGLLLVFSPETLDPRPRDNTTMDLVGGIAFIVIPSLIILTGWTFAVCVFLAGRNLARQRRYTFCLVMAAIMCIFMPFGTVLGVFTIIVLMRPSVRPLFEGQEVEATIPSSTKGQLP